jgi:2-iminobutanoate/2-iminopropanoate deaminase
LPFAERFWYNPAFVCLTENEAVVTVKEIIQTEHAPQAIGPYSQAVKTNGLVFASGQIPTDPQTGQFVPGGIEEQTEQVLKNLAAVLEAAGSGLNRVVKTTVFLLDMQEFGAMNEVYGRFFKEEPPARATVQAARLPRDARVEIEAIALALE